MGKIPKELPLLSTVYDSFLLFQSNPNQFTPPPALSVLWYLFFVLIAILPSLKHLINKNFLCIPFYPSRIVQGTKVWYCMTFTFIIYALLCRTGAFQISWQCFHKRQLAVVIVAKLIYFLRISRWTMVFLRVHNGWKESYSECLMLS